MACIDSISRSKGVEAIPSPPLIPAKNLEFGNTQKIFKTVLEEGSFISKYEGPGRELGGFTCYKLIEKIGNGSGGSVFLINRYTKKPPPGEEENNQVAVLKIMDNKANFKKEVHALKKSSPHPNIIKLIEAFSINKKHLIAVEEGGINLLEAYIENKVNLSSRQFVKITRQILEGLKFLHGRGVMHLDIKPENLLVNVEGEIKIIDFDSAEFGESYELDAEELKTTAYYRAPEHDMERTLYPKSDIFSTACTLYELVTHRPLFYTLGNSSTLPYRVTIFMQIFKSLGSSRSPLKEAAIMQECEKKGFSPPQFIEPQSPNREWEKMIPHKSCSSFLTSLLQYVDTRPSSEEALKRLSEVEVDDAPIPLPKKPSNCILS